MLAFNYNTMIRSFDNLPAGKEYRAWARQQQLQNNNHVIDEAYNEIKKKAREFILESGVRLADIKAPQNYETEFSECVRINSMERAYDSYEICRKLSEDPNTVKKISVNTMDMMIKER
eukprot:768657-Hanusia_phi.AAC.9